MRVIALIIVISMTFAIVLTQARPILAKPTLLGIGLVHLIDLMAEGCGPGWHWSNRRGWNWGHCVLDWRRFGNGRHRRPGHSNLGLCFVLHSGCRFSPAAERSTAGCAQFSIVEGSSSSEGSSYRCPRASRAIPGPPVGPARCAKNVR